MATFRTTQENAFYDVVIDSNMSKSSLIEDAIDWIQANCYPEDVFDKKALEEWAENNGYTKEE